VVPADSPIRTVHDLKGNRIGVMNLASGAAAALFVTKQVEVLGLWDGQYALIENLDSQY